MQKNRNSYRRQHSKNHRNDKNFNKGERESSTTVITIVRRGKHPRQHDKLPLSTRRHNHTYISASENAFQKSQQALSNSITT
jgi:hypothetical protein